MSVAGLRPWRPVGSEIEMVPSALPVPRWPSLNRCTGRNRKVMKMDSFEWTELDRLTARLAELQSRREAAAQDRLDPLGGIEDEIRLVNRQRSRIVTHLTRALVHHVAV